MKESYGKDPASHPDPESCVGGREAAGEALTGAHAGQPLSSEITSSGVPTPYGEGEVNIAGGAKGEPPANAAESTTLSMRGNSSHEKREIPRVPAGRAGRPDKVHDRNSGMYALGRSDDCVVPEKPPNKGVHEAPAEVVEGIVMQSRGVTEQLIGRSCNGRAPVGNHPDSGPVGPACVLGILAHRAISSARLVTPKRR